MGGEERSEYGLKIIKDISEKLTKLYGKGYDRSNLYHCLKFYKTFPEIVDTMCRQSGRLLSWSHYRALLQQLFAPKYKLYLPTEEELRAEIETQKAMFLLQQKEKENDNKE